MKRIPAFVCLLALAFSCGEKPETPSQETTKPVTFTVQPSSLEFTAAGGSQSLALTTDSKSWKATVSSGEWATVSPASGTGSQTLTVTVPANEGERRMVTVSFSDASGAKGSAIVSIVQDAASEVGTIVPNPAAFDNKKRASTTYQLLIYTFADSNGDGVGDFKGIQDKLDYLDGLGVTALWLSPAHPTSSYHGYDVDDYYTVNPLFGTEQDFKNLIDAAHARDIKIYMDYVLNHSGSNNSWFKQALADPSGKYRDYYFISSNPASDYARFPMLANTEYKSGEWRQATSGAPKLTITKTEEAVTNGTSNWNLWFWQEGKDGQAVRFTDKGDGTYYLVMEISGGCGMLVRRYMNWDNGSKFGASGNGTLTEGTAMTLAGDGNDISFTGSGRYKIELTDVTTETVYYMGAFDQSMPDLNYGDLSDIESNACFQDLAASADKWINMGVDGFRLDAVKHICGGIDSYSHASNRKLLKKWYEHCNATYKAAGHSDNIFMVAEEWDGHSTEMQYYESLTSCFEFDYGSMLSEALNNRKGSSYASAVIKYVTDHEAKRSDAVTSLFLTNHDQDRWSEWVGRSLPKQKQAAAMLLTSAGKPFVYMGEELGYTGKRTGNSDAPRRMPMAWDSNLSNLAKYGLDNNHKSDNTDYSVVTGAVSVAAQEADAGSLLNVYKTWSRLRNTYPALADGKMSEHETLNKNSSSPVAAWYMTSGDQKLLVIHNLGSETAVTVSNDLSHPIALLGTASVSGKTLKLGANSSVVFQL